ncbi:hypothetical protein EV182_006620 [Spiromyces aspiralis]|uniref:Uncharacterized protein n=1 Tax=Spiromyces aspiralis TaxID=68401 RepID=A0ACC1HAM8_9FUNG|nr:hypothetical protein EV182_006620 [Spiromyces aspiralis]
MNTPHEFIPVCYKLVVILLTFRLPTIAALNGHAFGGGCLLALAHDFRVMCENQGYICMNEIELPVGLPAGFVATVKSKLNNPIALRNCVYGHRFTAGEALKVSLIDNAALQDKVFPTAIDLAMKISSKAKQRGVVLHQIKAELYHETVKTLLTSELIPGTYLSKL